MTRQTRVAARPAGARSPVAVALWATVVAGALLYAAVLAGLHAGSGDVARWGALLGGAVVLGAGLALAPRATARTGLRAVVVGAVLFRALLFPAPAGSDDIYRFLWDGRVQGAGVNPYRYAPDDPALAPLRDDAVWPRINRSHVRTIYPPAAQGTFLAAWAGGLRSVHGFKTIVVAADLAALALLVRLLRRERRNRCWSVAYAWNPAVLLGFAHAGHLESLVVLALLVAVLAWRADRPGWAGAALGVAGSLKLYPLVVLPALLRRRDGGWRWPAAATVAGAAVGVLAVSYLPYLPGIGPGGVVGYLPGYLAEEGFTTGRRYLLFRALGLDGRVYAPLVGAGIALLVLRSRRPAATRAAWLLGGALVLTTPPYPWYLTPLVALAVAGGAGWAWPWLAVAFEASYVSIFFTPEHVRVSIPIRQAAAGAVVVLAVLALRWRRARRAVVWQPTGQRDDAPADRRPHGAR